MPFDLVHFLRDLPTEPGVYRMRDQNGDIIYVGKAAHLKKRISSYFSQQLQSVKTQALVRRIASVDVTVTRSEKEALLLESHLIKTLKPKYNVLMRDDKSYPYLHLTLNHPFPSMERVRTKKKPQTKGYFGPYPGIAAVHETLQLIQKIFKLRNCNDRFFNARSRPCLQYQLQRCSAPCTGLISEDEYQYAVKDAVLFLQGKSQSILASLEQRMNHAVSALLFEEAAVLRDQIKQLRSVQEQQGIVSLRGDADVIVIIVQPGVTCVQWVSVRSGQITDSQSFFPSVPSEELGVDELWQQVFEAFVTYFYQDNQSQVPPIIITDHDSSNLLPLEQLLSDWRGSACSLKTKPRGVKARWLDFALNNAEQALGQRNASTDLMRQRYDDLTQFLDHHDPLSTQMVCFDISHTQGTTPVASCVVFNAHGPFRRAYRRYNIEGITPGDDYAAIESAVTRHFKRLWQEESELPWLALIDGGAGQVACAQRALASLGFHSVLVLGIAKGPERKVGLERLVWADGSPEKRLPSDSRALHALQYLRDEAHRFARAGHQKRRHKDSLGSSLLAIEGVGQKRRHALLQRFGGIRELSVASIEEIAKVSGVSASLALKIYQHFHGT